MLTIRDYQTRQWDVPSAKGGDTPKVKEPPQKPPALPVDEVVLQRRLKTDVKDKEKEEEYLLATYWG
jgi:hypothetical protein